MSTLTLDADGLRRLGQPHRIISGALHYFRVHPELWEDRLKRLVALGCNTVETYVAWNFHAPEPDRVVFDGAADVEHFLNLAAGLGLDVIVRPGPYICAEWEGGGFPGWLLRDDVLGPAPALRCQDPRYLSVVDDWFDQLIPRLARHQHSQGGPVVAVQVENEYGSYGDDTGYLEYLRDGLRRRGIDELLVTSDGPDARWLRGGVVDGAWPTLNFGSRSRQIFAGARAELGDQPQMCMEFWNGWFDHWGEEHHLRPAEQAADELDQMFALGMHANIYVAHGGTSFGLWAGANTLAEEYQPTVTSYDYDAPIAEDGRLTAKFHAFREVISRYRDLPALAEQLADLGVHHDPPVMAGQSLHWQAVSCWPELASWQVSGITHPQPPSFESVGLERGMLLLRRRVEVSVDPDGVPYPLRFHGLADRVHVLVDGVLLGVASRNDPRPGMSLESLRERVAAADGRLEVRLELLVENQGRVNFGPLLGERKGILGGVWHGMRFLNGWEVTPLPLDGMGAQLADECLATAGPSAPEQSPRLPILAVTTLHSPGGLGAHLDTSGCGRGIAWIDDVCLGRYWRIGPQQTLYIPPPLLTPGPHRITILELEQANPRLALTEQPRLAETSPA